MATLVPLFTRTGIPPTEYYPFLLLMLPIMVAITLVHLFLIEGAPYFWSTHLGGLTIGASKPGLYMGLTLGFRLGTMEVPEIMV